MHEVAFPLPPHLAEVLHHKVMEDEGGGCPMQLAIVKSSLKQHGHKNDYMT
jgi:hypothetical protein